MYAIIENGSHQYRVAEGDTLIIDRRPGTNPGDSVVFDKVLLVGGGEGGPLIGTPTLAGAQVVAEVVKEFRGKKILIRKFRRRKGYRRRKGHRQYYTTVRITQVVAGV